MEFPGLLPGKKTLYEVPMPAPMTAVGTSGHRNTSEIPFVFPISRLTPWIGNCRGHWEDDTLVVVTKNYRPELASL